MAVSDMLRGRQVIHTLTNRSGGSVAAGDVVVIGDGTNDNCFTTTTTASFNSRMVGVAAETIASLSAGRVIVEGYAPLVNTNASVARDTFLFTHTVAKEATGSATRAAGAFGQVLETGADPEAVIWGMPDASAAGAVTVATDTIWDAKGDLAVGTGADTAARLAVGTNDHSLLAASGETTGLKWGQPAGTLLGYKIYEASNITYNQTSATLGDADATNLIVTFTAPASTNVLVRLTGVARQPSGVAAGARAYWGLRESTTIVGGPMYMLYAVASPGANVLQCSSAAFVLTGISAGSHSYKWAIAGDGTYGGGLYVNTGAPAVMEVWAL